ncbi:MAG: tail fiber domain-containing protein [Pyrinomonadaceae bacterium]
MQKVRSFNKGFSDSDKPTKTNSCTAALTCLFILIFGATSAFAQTTDFSYQGFVTDNSAPANGNYDIEFRLFDVPTGGTFLVSNTLPNVPVRNGVFSVVLGFGQILFDDYYLEIAVKPAGGGTFTTLSPRSRMLSTPFAINANNAQNATNATNAANATTAQNAVNAQNAINAQTAQDALSLGGTAANQFVLTGDARLSDARNPLPNSANYVQNTTTPQGTSNFNISGNGTAGGTLTGNLVRATTHFNIGGDRILSNGGAGNLFAGKDAGAENTTGSLNAFFGAGAGDINTTGAGNSFFGTAAGGSNLTGTGNSFFGLGTGQDNTSGGNNSFFGTNAGASNTTAINNSFFGAIAGNDNTTGHSNAFFGSEAGSSNTLGGRNSFFGYQAGRTNAAGARNSFFGTESGLNSTGQDNSFFGDKAGRLNTSGVQNTFFGARSGESTTSGDANVFIGFNTGTDNVIGSNNTVIGANASLDGATSLSYATVIGAGAEPDSGAGQANNTITLGRVIDLVHVPGDVQLGGSRSPTGSERLRLRVAESAYFGGYLEVGTLGNTGSTTVCHNSNSKRLSTCSSSLRYKTNVFPFKSGLSLVHKLQPISFRWRSGGMTDLGLGAEDVAKVEPLLVTHNDQGEVEGVKYDRIAVVLVNAVKEQQTQITEQKNQLGELKTENGRMEGQLRQQQLQVEQQGKQIIELLGVIEALRDAACQINRQADICNKEKE